MPKRKRTKPTVKEKSSSPDVVQEHDEPQLDTVIDNDNNNNNNNNNRKANILIFRIPNDKKPIDCQRIGASNDPSSLIFTHGAGGKLDAPAMVSFADGFSKHKSLLYFEGNMNLKSRVKFFQAVIEHEDWAVNLGGRSMGSRAAVTVAHNEERVECLVLVSYPLSNSKGDVRDQILLDLREEINVLFIIGDRDTMCDIDALNDVRKSMKAKSWLVIVNGADHGMNMKPKSLTDEIGRITGEVTAKWLDKAKRSATKTESTISWDEENETVSHGTWFSS